MAKRATGRWESWEGGRLWIDVEGRRTFYIRKRIDGARYEVRTAATTARAALEQLKRFEADPKAYDPAGEQRPDSVFLTAELVKEYLEWSAEEGQTKAWRAKKRTYLAFWAEKLRHHDLRGLDKRVILACVPKNRTPGRPHRIAVLKALYEYLRNPAQRLASHPEEPTLTAAEDPMIDFRVPQRPPAQSHGGKAPVPVEHLALVMEAMTGQVYRDAFTLMVGTGWRGTEIPRFGAEGVIEPIPKGQARDGAVAILGVFSAKATQRRWKRVQVSARLRDAAKRLQAHGSFDLARLDKAIRSACEAKGIEPFGYGRIRHTVKGWTKAKGVLPALAAQAMGHTVEVAERDYGQTTAAPPIPSPLDAIPARTGA
jgi:hypothetical protein